MAVKNLSLSLDVVFGVCSLQAKTVDRIIAIVNSDVLLSSEVDAYKKKLKDSGLVDEILLNLRDRKKLISDRNALVEHMIDERVLDSEVKRQGLEVTIERIEQEIRKIAKDNGITRNQLKAALQQRGVSFSDYQDFIRTTLQRKSLVDQEVISKVKISDDDITSYYISKKGAKNSQIFEYTLAHILFLESKGGDQAALNRALKVLDRLKGGMAFAQAASQYSEDPGFSQGGKFGTFKYGEMRDSLEKAVTGLAIGEPSKVLKTRGGYHIVQVVKKTLVASPELEREKQQLRAELMQKNVTARLLTWVEQKRKDSFIRINK